MKIIRAVAALFCALLFGFMIQEVKAEETKQPLKIEPILPENQTLGTKGYFHLDVHPGERQSLDVRITNTGNEEVSVSMQSANAFTNPTGGMLYKKELDSPDTILLDDAVRMADYMEIEETMVVPPLSSVELPFEVSIPEVKGKTFLGGILLTIQGEAEEQQKEVEKGTANFVLKTETVYALAVQADLPNEVPANFSLGQVGFIPETAQVFIEMSNDAQKIQTDIKGTYAVSDHEDNELFSGEFGSFKMAPKTKIRHPFHWGYEMLEDGTYTLTIEGTAGAETITASETFTIKNNDIEEYVKRTDQVPQVQLDNRIPVWVWVLGAILLGAVMFFIGRKKT